MALSINRVLPSTSKPTSLARTAGNAYSGKFSVVLPVASSAM